MKMLLFLQRLETALNPGVNRHHFITTGCRGERMEGCLMLHVWIHPHKSGMYSRAIDDADKQKDVDALINEIVQQVRSADES